ncbi:MAG: pyridoxal phosphate-dependent aminotransferase [Eubacteriaceae bacterium]|jgi:aspartate aminotransferase|nr:pyridoxal phosphate-dependent aminotransferase [Eubacteriaceae bacterium]
MLSNIVKNITPSATQDMEVTVADMLAEGIDVIGFNAGEPDMGTPDFISEACKKAIDEGRTKYVNTVGIFELREAICRKLKRDNGLEYDPAQICVSTGAKQAVNNAVKAVVNPGDEVIIPSPCWVSYEEMVKMVGGIPVTVPTLNDFQLDVDAIEKAVNDKTAAIIINTPNNPTGAVYTEEILRKLADIAIKNDFYIITDEIYEKLIYSEKKHFSIASISKEAYDRTIVINGFSKAYRMTGWRVGYTAAPKEIADGIASIQGHTTSNSTTFVQYAAVEALRYGNDDISKMVREFERRKNYIYSRLVKIDGITCSNVDGAFYLMPNISAFFERGTNGKRIKDSYDFCNYILEEARVAVLPGAAFRAPDCVRIAYTNSFEKIKEGMDRIERALITLNKE